MNTRGSRGRDRVQRVSANFRLPGGVVAAAGACYDRVVGRWASGEKLPALSDTAGTTMGPIAVRRPVHLAVAGQFAV
jgi:hypothetical protein